MFRCFRCLDNDGKPQGYLHTEMSKGSRPRAVDIEKFNREFDRIFSKRGSGDSKGVPSVEGLNRQTVHQGNESTKTKANPSR